MPTKHRPLRRNSDTSYLVGYKLHLMGVLWHGGALAVLATSTNAKVTCGYLRPTDQPWVSPILRKQAFEDTKLLAWLFCFLSERGGGR